MDRLAAELVQLNPAVLVVSITEAALAAKKATSTIPIVKEAAKSLAVQISIVEARPPTELEGAFSTLRTNRVGAVLVLGGGALLLRADQVISSGPLSLSPAVGPVRLTR